MELMEGKLFEKSLNIDSDSDSDEEVEDIVDKTFTKYLKNNILVDLSKLGVDVVKLFFKYLGGIYILIYFIYLYRAYINKSIINN